MQLNPSKPILGIVSTLAFLYLIYLFLSGDPLERINRTCAPFFQWPAKVVVGGVRIFAPGSAQAVETKFDTGFQTCRQWVWNSFYAADYARLRTRTAEDQRGGANQ